MKRRFSVPVQQPGKRLDGFFYAEPAGVRSEMVNPQQLAEEFTISGSYNPRRLRDKQFLLPGNPHRRSQRRVVSAILLPRLKT
ncbi:hypothetical protein D3C74_452360 [compost metagenome]